MTKITIKFLVWNPVLRPPPRLTENIWGSERERSMKLAQDSLQWQTCWQCWNFGFCSHRVSYLFM